MRYTSNIRYALGASVLTFLTGLAGCAPTRSTGTPAATPPPLAYTKVLEGVSDLGQAEARVTAALKSQGFGIITRVDVQTTMKEKLGREFRPYVILGACNPGFALKTLEHDPIMGLLLPCKAILYQRADGAIVLSLARPKTMFTLVSAPALEKVAQEVESRFQKVFDSL